jgi:uncharacterized membrane protein
MTTASSGSAISSIAPHAGQTPNASPAGPSARIGGRLHFLDGLRGVALILMVVNHTSRDWMDVQMGWARYHLVYGSLILPASIFLFLVGFCLPISYHHRAHSEGFIGDFRRYFRRGIGIVAAGYLLNLIMLPPSPVPPEERLWHGGVLQTIGLSIILLGPLVPVLRRRWTRWALPAIAVLIYLSYWWSHASLVRWCEAHPIPCTVAFGDFPPWPWIAPALIGLALGWVWLETRARGPAPEARYFGTAAIVGLVFLAAYGFHEWRIPTVPRFGFNRDLGFGLNHYWTPRGVTTFLIIAGVAWLLALCYWLMEVRRWELPWLVTLGQTALVLYFAHQVIEETLIHRALGIRFNNWITYWPATIALIVLCVYMGRAWRAVKPRFRRLVGLQAA